MYYKTIPSSDFTASGGLIAEDQFCNDVEDAIPTRTLDSCYQDFVNVYLRFDDALTAPEEITLAGIVAAHTAAGRTIVSSWSATLAALQAFGTNDGLAIGHRGWDETNRRDLYCLTATTTTSTWGYKATQLFRFTTASSAAALRYWIHGSGIQSSISSSSRIQARYPGQVVRYDFRAANDIAYCLLGVHLNMDTTPTETKNVDPGASVLVGADFVASPFVADDILTFAITPSADPGFSNAVVEVVYEVPA